MNLKVRQDLWHDMECIDNKKLTAETKVETFIKELGIAFIKVQDFFPLIDWKTMIFVWNCQNSTDYLHNMKIQNIKILSSKFAIFI